MTYFKASWAALGAALLVAACGGGGDGNQSPKVALTAVKVMGDQLSDSGTFVDVLPAGNGFGRIFSVQGSTHRIWTERVAAAFGKPSLCSFYKYTGAGFAANSTPGCTSFAVGGGRINNALQPGGAASPASIIKQLQDAGNATPPTASDLLLIDGGGVDASDLVGAYLGTAAGGAAITAYATLLSSVVDPTVVGTTLGTGAAGFASIGGVYMTALADKFYDAIKTNALDKGATHVAIVNMPSITNTPRFQMVLDSIAAANGGGTAGATARAQSEGLFRSWVQAFNAQLQTRASANSGMVVVVDFATNLDAQTASPAQYGLTNVTTPACPAVGTDGLGLPTYNLETCTDVALSAQTPPAGATGGADWWKTYAYADGTNPTPYGYQLLAQLVSKALITAGWL
jgi:phospholipase/lecithinase/hemolysin